MAPTAQSDAAVARPCPACESPSSRFAFTAAGYAHVRCRRCDTLFVAQLPEPGVIESTYLAPDYHSSAQGQEQRMRAEAGARVAVLQTYGLRDILEVGCGPGHFLDAARDAGMRIEGVDRARTAEAPRQRGHQIHDQWFQDFGPPTGRLDAVAMWEVIEHVPEPRQILARARQWLRVGGLLALSTPSSSGLPARALGPKFPMVCPPDHLALFSRRGLQTLLGAAGFEAVRWTSFSGLGRPQLRRGLQRFALGDSRPARALSAALALAAEPLVRVLDRAGYGSAFEVYAVAR